MRYTKSVEVSSTGMVIVSVCNDTGRKCGLAFFSPFFGTNKGVERMCRKAHTWADERIRICEKQEV